jgi:hypothetical protein
MDIRNATAPKGTKQQRTVTPEVSKVKEIQAGDETPVVTKEEVEDYGDEKVAKAMAVVKEAGLTKEDLFVVQDTLITTNNVVWDTEVFGRVKCCFQVRPSWVTNYIMEKLSEKTGANPSMTVGLYNNLLAEYNLAASLMKYGDHTFNYTNVEEFEEVYAAVLEMPYAILAELSQKCLIFDNIILAATSDWAIKNFTKPQQDK